MTGKESDEKVQKITKLLEKGGTMLATHHDCGAPMFRYQGKIVCPVCDFQDKNHDKIGESDKQRGKIEQQQIGQGQQNSGSSGISGVSPQPVLQISNIIANKIRNLTATLETETELGRIREKLECIELGVRILKLLRDND
jgi:UPF0148 protein